MGDIPHYVVQWFFDQQLYDVLIHGICLSVTVTAEAYIAIDWVRDVTSRYRTYLRSGTAVVGMNIQWSPQSQRGNGSPCTLQLCVSELCLVYQLSRAESVPPILRLFLMIPEITFVGFWNSLHGEILANSHHAIEMRNGQPLDLIPFMDSEVAYGTLEAIVELFLGCTTVMTSSDWGSPILSIEQVLTASIQAHYAFFVARWIQGF